MKGFFTQSLITEQIGHELWKIVKGFSFHSATGRVVVVSKGFTCDLASIPAFAQCLIPKVGYWSQAAVVHDLLYRNHRAGLDTTISRSEADRVLREGCTVRADDFSVSRNKRRTKLIYIGVRAGGLESWETPDERQARIDQWDNSNIID